MTLASDNRVTEEYDGDGETLQFPFDFPLFDSSESNGVLVRYVDDTSFTTVPQSEYTVVENTGNVGGYIQFNTAPASGKKVQIVGNTEVDQQLVLTNGGKFNAESIEINFDKLVAINQEWLQSLSDETKLRIANELELTNRIDLTDENLANEIALRIQADTILQNQITSNANSIANINNIIQEAINNGTSPNLAVFSAQSVDDLSKLIKWQNRTVYVKNIGMYICTNDTWVQDLITERQVIKILGTSELSNLYTWANRTVYVDGIGFYVYDGTNWVFKKDTRTISNVSELRSTNPIYDYEVVFVNEHTANTGSGGGYFIYDPALSTTVFGDDNVINFVANGKIWHRYNANGKTLTDIPMEWGGVLSNYDSDQSAKVQAVFNAALTLATNRSATVLSKTRRVSVIPTPKLRCSKTIYFNLTFVQVKGESAEWSFDASGTYDNHPTAVRADNTTPVKMCLVGLGAAVGNTDSVACYRDRKDLSQMTLYLATSYVNDMPQVSKVDSGIALYNAYSNENTLRQAQVHLPNVSFIGGGYGFCNGNYSWGYEFDNCKFSENYYATWLVKGEDNGERFSFNHCIMQNNHHALWNKDWEGYFTIYGGSYVWNDGQYWHMGSAFGGYLRPNHVEYVTSTSPILTTDDNALAGTFPKLRVFVWEGGELAIARTNTDVITDKIELVKAGVGSAIYVREQSGYWNSIDYTPNMRIAQDKYPWDTSAGRVYVDNIGLSIGTWGVLGRTKSLINTPQTGILSNVFSTTIAQDAVINWVNNTVNDRYMQFKATAATSTANTMTFDIPINRVKDFFAIVPVCWFDSVTTTKNDWIVSFYAYNSRLGFGSNTSLGDTNLFNGSTEVYPLNQYSRPVQYLKTDLGVFAQVDTIRVVIRMPTGWGATDVINLRAAGAVFI